MVAPVSEGGSKMRILNDTTELQIRLRPDEVDGFIDMVLGATHSPIRRALVDGMKKECLL